MSSTKQRSTRSRIAKLVLSVMLLPLLAISPGSRAAAQEPPEGFPLVQFNLVACDPLGGDKPCNGPYRDAEPDLTIAEGRPVTFVATTWAIKQSGSELDEFKFVVTDPYANLWDPSDTLCHEPISPSNGIEELVTCSRVAAQDETRIVRLVVIHPKTDRQWSTTASATVTSVRPTIAVESSINGDPAATDPGVPVVADSTLQLKYVVTNTSDPKYPSLEISNVTLTHSRDGEAITCDGYDGPTIDSLAPGQSVECTATGVATVGSGVISVTAAGTHNGRPIEATDFSYFYGLYQPATLAVQSSINGDPAPALPGVEAGVGDTLRITYVVTNTSDQKYPFAKVNNIKLTHSLDGRAITCDGHDGPTIDSLAPGEAVECTATSTAEQGPRDVVVTATGIGYTGDDARARDSSYYTGVLPQPTPTPTAEPTTAPTVEPTTTPTPEPTTTVEPTPTPTAEPTTTPTAEPTTTPTVEPTTTVEPTPTPTAEPTPTPTAEPTPTPTAEPTTTPTAEPTPTPTEEPTPTAEPTTTPTEEPTPTAEPTTTPTVEPTTTPTEEPTPTAEPTTTPTVEPTTTPTAEPTPTPTTAPAPAPEPTKPSPGGKQLPQTGTSTTVLAVVAAVVAVILGAGILARSRKR